MIENFYLTHAVILLCAVGAVIGLVPESRGQTINRWRLLLPGVLAAIGAFVLILYPDFLQLFRPELWTLGAVAMLVGAARGRFIEKEMDQAWNLVRMTRARDGRWAAICLVVLAILEIAAELATPPDDHTYMPTAEFGTIIAAGYLLGRSVVAWAHAGTLDQSDLYTS